MKQCEAELEDLLVVQLSPRNALNIKSLIRKMCALVQASSDRDDQVKQSFWETCVLADHTLAWSKFGSESLFAARRRLRSPFDVVPFQIRGRCEIGFGGLASIDAQDVGAQPSILIVLEDFEAFNFGVLSQLIYILRWGSFLVPLYLTQKRLLAALDNVAYHLSFC